MKKKLFIIFVLAISFNTIVSAQTDSKSSASAIFNCLRAGIGIEKSPYVELGYSWLYINNKDWASSTCFYGSAQLNPVKGKSALYGGKIGIESAWMIGMVGAELKYLTNGNISQFYLTPKAGLSLLGGCSLLYGYNISANDKFEDIGVHQLSLTANFSKKLIKFYRR